jgi:parkin
MLIFVKSLKGNTIALEVAPHETVADLKDKINANFGVMPTRQRLVFSGKNISDTLTLGDCGIQDDSAVWMVEQPICG